LLIGAAELDDSDKFLLVYLAFWFAVSSTFNADHKQTLSPEEWVCGWISVVFMTLPLPSTISLSLRLDFANYILSVGPLHLMSLEEVPVGKMKFAKDQLTKGITVPNTLPFTFKCPYFVSTLLAWFLANATVTYLLGRGWLPDTDHFGYMFYVTVCAIPMVVASAGAVSVVRDEKDRVWKYEERWNLKSIAEKTSGSDTEKEAADIEVKSTPYTSI
jgi:hypothetical protein